LKPMPKHETSPLDTCKPYNRARMTRKETVVLTNSGVELAAVIRASQSDPFAGAAAHAKR